MIRISIDIPSSRLVAGLLALLLAMTGCARGPDEEAARNDLQAHIDSRFQAGLFDISVFKRTGSAPFRDVEQGISGLYIYYDVELVFEKDYNLADWQGLNLGTLSYVLGATESGVKGFKLRGNARGEALQVSGRMPYQELDGNWVAFADDRLGPRTTAEQAQRVRGPGPDAVLGDARSLLARSPEVEDEGSNAIIISELERAVGRIDLRQARLQGRITLATGPVAGTYHGFGSALSRYANKSDTPMYAFPSYGSVQNASLLQNGAVDFGLVQSDVAQFLYKGDSPEGFFPSRNLRTVASLWPEAVHVVTLAGSDIATMYDLFGRRVAIGLRGSGSRVNAMLIGLAAEIGGDELPDVLEISLAQAIRELEQGSIDAFFLTEAVPAPALQALASRRRDLRFLSMSDEVIEALTERHFAYYPMVVAARTYPHQEQPFKTLGLAAALMTSEKVADEKVEQLLEGILDGSGELARTYYRAGFVTRDTMRLGIAVPLHPAAERVYSRLDSSTAGTSAPGAQRGLANPAAEAAEL